MTKTHMAASMFLSGHGIKAKTHDHADITYFPIGCISTAWEAQGHRPSAFQALVMHLVGKCAISAWAWVLAIWFYWVWDITQGIFLCIVVEAKYRMWYESKKLCL